MEEEKKELKYIFKYGIIKHRNWVVTPEYEEYTDRELALKRYVDLRRRCERATAKIKKGDYPQVLSQLKDSQCKVFNYVTVNGADDMLERMKFFFDAEDILSQPQLDNSSGVPHIEAGKDCLSPLLQ